jgi:hypothetical protein
VIDQLQKDRAIRPDLFHFFGAIPGNCPLPVIRSPVRLLSAFLSSRRK